MKNKFFSLAIVLVGITPVFAEASIPNQFLYPEQTYLGNELEVNPVKEMVIMQKKLGSMFDAMMREGYMKTYSSSPAMDFQDLGDKYVAKLDMPGMTKEAINVEIKETTLTVTGEREAGSVETDTTGYYRKERSASSFKRVIALPGEVKVDQVDAKYENGVLTLSLPKLKVESGNNKKIEIR